MTRGGHALETVTLGTVVRAPSIVSTELRSDGVFVIALDDPREAHNTLTPQLGAELAAALGAAEADPRVRATVVVSAKKDSFLVGANLDYLRAFRFATDAEEASREAGKRFARIADSVKPVVACVHGPALGGGFELALACAATVATSDPRTLLGLPEVKLGLMPAANGLLRVAQRAGLRVAIDLGLTGRDLTPAKALALGLVDEVVAPASAQARACALALRLAAEPELRLTLRARRAWTASRLLLETNPLGRSLLFRRARAEAAEKTQGHYPAPSRILDVLERFGRRRLFGPSAFEAASALESRLFGELVVSETSHRLVELFFLHAASKKDQGVESDERARAQVAPPAKIAVVGAGLAGAAIAAASVEAGLTVVRLANLPAAPHPRGLASADLVVQAVAADLTVEQAVLRQLETLVSDTCVIASATASLSIARIAEAATHPQRVLGMHYGIPVRQAPLLEVIRAPLTAPSAVATAVALGKRQGKTVIVVRDGAGSYTTRILTPFLNEAVQLLTEGISVDQIDRALLHWGFVTGPLHLLDEIGIDVASHVAESLTEAVGERMRGPALLAELARDDRRGRKNGRGFYLHGQGARRVDDTVYRLLHLKPRAAFMQDEVGLRCALPLINEALRCLDEGILRSVRDGDVGAVLGLGFPAFRGGPFRYVDVLGAPEVLRRTRSLEQRFGARFTPAPLLVEAARRGRRFYG